MSYQQRLFDGYTVEAQRGSIGSFDIEEVDTDHYRADQVLVLVVTATVSGASFSATKAGDWVRTNKLTASQVHVVTGEQRDEIVEMFNLAGDELPFPPHDAAAPAAAVGNPVGLVSTPVDSSVIVADDAEYDEDDDGEWEDVGAQAEEVLVDNS